MEHKKCQQCNNNCSRKANLCRRCKEKSELAQIKTFCPHGVHIEENTCQECSKHKEGTDQVKPTVTKKKKNKRKKKSRRNKAKGNQNSSKPPERILNKSTQSITNPSNRNAEPTEEQLERKFEKSQNAEEEKYEVQRPSDNEPDVRSPKRNIITSRNKKDRSKRKRNSKKYFSAYIRGINKVILESELKASKLTKYRLFPAGKFIRISLTNLDDFKQWAKEKDIEYD